MLLCLMALAPSKSGAQNTFIPQSFGPLICLDSSGSGTAQVCNTNPSFTVSAGASVVYKTTTTNTGDVTLNVNSLGAKHIRKSQAQSILAAGDLVAGVYALVTYDGTYWEMYATGNPAACSGCASVSGVQNQSYTFITGGGSANAQTATLSPVVGSYAAGLIVNWIPAAANTTSTPTLNVNGLGAKTIIKNGGAVLAPGDLSTTAVATAIYDGTSFELQNAQTGGLCPTCALESGVQNQSYTYASGGGSANTQTLTLSPAVTSYVAGLTVSWLPTAANTTTVPTLNVNGLGVKTIVKAGGSALSAGDLSTTAVATAVYDGTNFELQNPQVPPSGAFCSPGAFASLTDGATITWAINSVQCAYAKITFGVHSGSRTLNITGVVNGGSYGLEIIQDATGGEDLILGSGCTGAWLVSFNGGGTIATTHSASAHDFLGFTYDGANCIANYDPQAN